MTRTRRRILVLAVPLFLGLAACGLGDGDAKPASVKTKQVTGTIERIKAAGTVKVGIKTDQPGLGYLNPTSGEASGFDVEIAKLIVGKLGVAPEKIRWVKTVSADREVYLQKGTVDIVAATYSITDGRRLVVGQAGPYYVTGQQLLVRKDDRSIGGPESLTKKKVCSTKGSTSIQTVEENFGAVAKPLETYGECVEQLLSGDIDAVTTDGSILLGLAAQHPDKLQVVGDTFSEERYGIGFPKGDTAFCTFVVETLRTAFKDGSWQKAYDVTLGKSGTKAPQPPSLDPCV